MASKEKLPLLFPVLVRCPILGDDYSTAADTLCSIFSKEIMASLNKTIIIVKRESQLPGFNVEYKVIAGQA